MPDSSKSLGARVNRALGQLLLLGNAPGVDATRDAVSNGSGGHGTHGERGKAPTDFQPLVIEWAEFFRRACDMAELDLAQERGEVERPTETRKGRVSAEDSRRRRQRIQRAAIYRGRRPEFVAYVEGCSVTLVREARQAGDLDPLTGQRAEKPLTTSRPQSLNRAGS